MTAKTCIYFVLCALVIISPLFITEVNGKYRSSSHHHTSSVSRTSHSARSSGSHGYPSHSGGHSGSSSGSHGYPPHSGGHSGSSGSHTYPSLSGGSSAISVQKHTVSNSASSYPSSSGLSGSAPSRTGYPLGGSSYPLSGGLSGNTPSRTSYPSGSSSYPSSGGLSGNTPSRTSYPSGSSSYPSSGGLSGNTPSRTGYPSANSLPTGTKPNTANYPQSTGLSGNTASGVYYPGKPSYPNNNPTYNSHQSTNWGSNQNTHNVYNNHQTVIHTHQHYHYSPPTVIHYSSSYGMSPVSYPVYRGVPPLYVYEYRSSGNKYSNLLAGLALYNLGRMSGDTRARDYYNNYRPQPNEHCQFGVRYNTGAVEEMAIDCQAISYFIYEAMQANPQVVPQTQTYTTTNTVNQTTITTQSMLPNGTLVTPSNAQIQVIGNSTIVPNTQQILSGNGKVVNSQQTNTVTTTTQVVSVNDAKLLGRPVEVTSNMECYVSRTSHLYTRMQKPVPCGLLHEYAALSLRRNSAVMVKSSMTAIIVAVVFILI